MMMVFLSRRGDDDDDYDESDDDDYHHYDNDLYHHNRHNDDDHINCEQTQERGDASPWRELAYEAEARKFVIIIISSLSLSSP